MKTDLAIKLLNLPPVRVLVVGDAITDVDMHGQFERFAQEAPSVPIFKVERREERPGGAGAVVAMAIALGAEVVTLLANDDWSVKTRCYADGHQFWRMDQDTTKGRIDAACITDAVCDTDIVLIADYGKGTCTEEVLDVAIGGAIARGIPCIVDPAHGTDWRKYKGVTAIKCNHPEMEVARFEPWAPGIFCRLIMTHGARGIFLGDTESSLESNPQYTAGCEFKGRQRTQTDVTGCGDMVLAALGVCIGGGMTWEDACHVANSAAGLKVERRGAVPVSRAEVLEDLCDGEKILPVGLLGEIVKGQKERGRKVAFTNGCFDVLHAGHVQYLQKARTQADVLIVGLNSDASVRALKGIGRPIQSEVARAAVLAGLQSVDFVVLFDSTTPVPLIEAIKPDVLVKGADYNRNQVAGADFVETRGGRVHLVPLSYELSTTHLIEKIRTRDRQDPIPP